MVCQTYDSATASFLASLAQAWEPRAADHLADWCEANLLLPPETSASPGPYDLKRYAYVRGVLDAVEDPEVEQIVLMWATQLGKTTLLQAVLAAMAKLLPIPAMLGTPDRASLFELRDKFYLLCEASPELVGLVPPPRLRNDRWIDLGSMRTHLAYSRATQTMSGKSCALVVCTELDRWRKTATHGDPAKIIAQRVKAFFHSTIIYESTPSDADSRIAKLYNASDRRRFLVPCPRCGRFQELRFFPHTSGEFAGRGGVFGLKDKKGNFLRSDEARHTAFYRCETGCKIESEEKPDMVAEGQWVPTGQDVTTAGKLTGKPKRGPRIWGSRLNSLYAEAVSFGKAAAEWLDSRDTVSELQVFYNDWLAKRWLRKAKVPRWRDLWRRLRGSFQPGIVPPWALFLTAGADVGPNYVRWVVRAWGEGGSSAKIDWGTTHKTSAKPRSHLEALTDVLLRRDFPLAAANAVGAKQLSVRLLNLDCGFKPHLVHEYHRSLAPLGVQDRVYQVVGVDSVKTGERWRSSVVERSARTGEKYEGGQTRWSINRAMFNADLHDRWKQPLDEPGAWWLTAAELGQCELYLRELVNEAPATTKSKYGRDVTTWQKVDTNVGNHYWDCEVYALAAADMVTGGDWHNLAARAAPARTAKPKQQLAAGDASAREFPPDDFSAR